MSWNKAFDICMDLKHDYIKNFGELKISQYDFKEMINTMKINNLYYHEIFDQLQINQFGNLVLLRYGIAELQRGFWNDKNSPLRECRSLVFDIKKEELVLTPFRKFFNLNEIEENSIENIEKEISKCELFEVSDKLDGSMQSYSFYDGKIVGSGSMALDADKSYRLKEGYQLLTENHKRMIESYPHYTFIFEYVSDKDKHVVPYNYSRMKGLHLIGIRNKLNGEELSYIDIEQISYIYRIPCAYIYNFCNLSEVLDYIENMVAEDGEGVVLNIDGHKLKIKNEDYLQLHRLDDKLSSPNVIIQAFADGSFDDLYANMSPLLKSKNEDTIKKIEKYLSLINKKIEAEYINLNHDIDNIIEVNAIIEDDCFINIKEIAMRMINEMPSDVREYVRMKYLGKEYNVLKSNNGKKRKMSEIEKWLDNDEI